MKVTNKMKSKCVNSIIEFMKANKATTKNEIIEGALLIYGLTKSEITQTSPRSKGGLLRSYMSTAFNNLLTKKDIERIDNGYALTKEELVIVTEEQCEAQIIKMLQSKSYSKSEIYSALDKHFGTKETKSIKDDNMLHSIAGNILIDLMEANKIELKNGVYQKKCCDEAEELDNIPLPEEEFKAKLYKRLWTLGGKNFESFCASVLEKYLTMSGQFVMFCDVTGGSDDGGIDIVIETIDGLGFYEKIMAQTKCRDRAHVTEKEVREFYGALNVLGGTRGLYITSTVFHQGALKLLDSLDNTVGIDGDKLFELIKKTEYGICKTKSGYVLDPAIFSK